MALVLGFVISPVYQAETALVAADTGEGSITLSGAMGQLGGLAELAGIQGGQSPTVTEALALLQSREFTENFIRDKGLLPELFRRRWDPELHQWKRWTTVPDLWDGYRRFDRKIRFVDDDEKTGIITLRIEWTNPREAADWANELVRRANAEMRERALTEAKTTLEYLNNELKTTKVTAVQAAIQDLIEANLKRKAIADVRQEYVFRVVDPAAPPNRRDKLRPNKLIYAIAGAFFGLLLSFLYVLAVDTTQTIKSLLKVAEARR
jgi:capsule polysaccharide export protein KpsE/RkpR